jgi:hypothetical protein
MADQELRDARGNLLGKIATASNGIQTIRDSKGILRGKYDPKANTTRDDKGNLVGKGNLLTSLLR